jgi:metal-sulfur cluster biosynthetic enzyme
MTPRTPDRGSAPSVDAVRAELNAVLDPCSCAAGVPAGLVDMGLVRGVEVSPGLTGATVSVRLTLTEPTCWMGYAFLTAARERLRGMAGVALADVQLVFDGVWRTDDMAPDYRRALAARRHAKMVPLGLPATRPGL